MVEKLECVNDVQHELGLRVHDDVVDGKFVDYGQVGEQQLVGVGNNVKKEVDAELEGVEEDWGYCFAFLNSFY